MDLNEFGKHTYECALKRGKISDVTNKNLLHTETIRSVHEELHEVKMSSELKESAHLQGYTEVSEELADVAIVVFTELYRRGVDIEKLLEDKCSFNEQR